MEEGRRGVTSHEIAREDLTTLIRANADYPSQAVLAVHFWTTYDVDDVGEALEAADGIENALDAEDFVVTDRARLNRLRTTARQILKLRKDAIPQRDTKWKIAWRDLEECCSD